MAAVDEDGDISFTAGLPIELRALRYQPRPPPPSRLPPPIPRLLPPRFPTQHMSLSPSPSLSALSSKESSPSSPSISESPEVYGPRWATMDLQKIIQNSMIRNEKILDIDRFVSNVLSANNGLDSRSKADIMKYLLKVFLHLQTEGKLSWPLLHCDCKKHCKCKYDHCYDYPRSL